jgi:hypothetical protein
MGALINKYKLWIVVVGVVVAGGVWFGLSSSPASNSVLTTTDVNNGSAADQDLVNTLLQLRAVSLNGAIFTNVAFMGLQDFSTHIVQEPVGRDDPFAPLDGSGSPVIQSASSTRAAQMFTNASTTSGVPSSTLPRAPHR